MNGSVSDVALSYFVRDQQTFTRSADVPSERHEVEKVVEQLPVGQGEGDVEQRRG